MKRALLFLGVALIAGLLMLGINCFWSREVPDKYRPNYKVEYFVVDMRQLSKAVTGIEEARSVEAAFKKTLNADLPKSGFSLVVFISTSSRSPSGGRLRIKLPGLKDWQELLIKHIGAARVSVYVFDCGDLVLWPAPIAKQYEWAELNYH